MPGAPEALPQFAFHVPGRVLDSILGILGCIPDLLTGSAIESVIDFILHLGGDRFLFARWQNAEAKTGEEEKGGVFHRKRDVV